MAAKVKCPGCGAKNAFDARRCRVCIVLINPDVPQAGESDDESPAAAMPADFDSSELQRQLDRRPGSATGQGIFTGPSGLAARIAATGNFPPLPHAPLPPKHLAPPIDLSPPIDLDPLIDLEPPVNLEPSSSLSPFSAWVEENRNSVDEPDAAYATSSGGVHSAAPTADGFEPFDPDALFRD